MIPFKAPVKILAAAIFFAITCLFFSCKKTDNKIINSQSPDFTSEVNGSVSGFVTNEHDEPVEQAEVQYGSLSGTTDKYGFFELKNTRVIQNAAAVTVTKPGYFKGIKTFIISANQSSFCRIKLIPKIITGAINSSNGGTVSLSNGLKVMLPANAVVNAITKTTYTGSVNVSSFWIDPTGADLHKLMPGDLWGTKTDGTFTGLATYGMAAIELSGSSGEILQIAEGKKATLTIAIPASLVSNAPSTIPLWYFDETKGYWKEEGTAIKTGDTYTGEVSHFSFWNCDAPLASVLFTCRIMDPFGNPVRNVMVNISSSTSGTGHGYTDSGGYVSGLIPQDAYQLNIVDNGCVIYTKPISVTNAVAYRGTTQSFYHIENIVIPSTSIATITGNITNCNNIPVTNGYLILTKSNNNYRVNTAGDFTIPTTLCNSNEEISLIAEDIDGHQQSTYHFTITHGTNNIGALQACGSYAEEFINYTVDGSSYSFTSPICSFTQYPLFDGNEGTIGGQNLSNGKEVAFRFGPAINNNISSTPDLHYFICNEIDASRGLAAPYGVSPIRINYTEYGAANEFIAGNFSGIVFNPPPSRNYNITCSFRVRRSH